MDRVKLIIDTDPGVDDNNALVYVLNDNRFDIKLITISNGNIGIKKSTRNVLHLLDVFGKDIPVVKGYEKRMGNNTEDAIFLHGKEGLGNYIPPRRTKHKALKMDCADAMYEVIKANPGEVTVAVLGPHTNMGYLLQKYPDAKDYIKEVIMMGGAPDGILTNPNHTSFNVRTDAPAFKLTIDSGLPITMCPSRIGRDVSHFTEEQVGKIANNGIIGKYLSKTYETYWEHGYPDERISTCDISAIYFLVRPELYTYIKCDIDLDTTNCIGKTTAIPNENGQFKLIKDVNREELQKMFFEMLDDINKVELCDKHFIKHNKK